MKKIHFVEPKCEVISHTRDLPGMRTLPILGPLLLATIVEKAGYEVEFIKDKIRDYDYGSMDVDVICLYSMTNTFPRAINIAKQYKKGNPDGKVIFGGPHVSFLPQEALNLKWNNKGKEEYIVDHIVLGEAEAVIVDVIKGKYKERLVQGKPVEDLNTLPKINFSLFKDIPKKGFWFPFSTSRGCPYRCKFCSVTKMFGTKFRFRSPKLVVEDILDAQKYSESKKMFFYDDNFFTFPKRSRELLKEMIKHDIHKDFLTQTRIDISKDEETLKLLSKVSSRVILFLGLESPDDETLKLYNKKQTSNDIIKAIKKIHNYNFKIVGNFVFGSDFDTKKTMDNIVEFANKTEVDFPATSILTPLPGTDLFYELNRENRIFSKDWSYYDLSHVVFLPKKMTPYELQDTFTEGLHKLYSLSNKRMQKFLIKGLINKRVLRNVKNLFSAIKTYKEMKKEQQRYLEYLKNLKDR